VFFFVVQPNRGLRNELYWSAGQQHKSRPLRAGLSDVPAKASKAPTEALFALSLA
jgi:hypothetical protein